MLDKSHRDSPTTDPQCGQGSCEEEEEEEE